MMKMRSCFTVMVWLTVYLLSCTEKAEEKTDVIPTENSEPQKATAIHPDLCRYQCYRLGFQSDEIADDLHILSEDTYELAGAKGRYSYDAATRMIKWLDGPLYQPSQDWVGIFTAKGAQTGSGGTASSAIIEIRRMKDVEDGNTRVLQNCACTE